MKEEMMCEVCNKKGTHNKFFCTYCKSYFGCTGSEVTFKAHINGGCIVSFCGVHKWHSDAPGEHYATCTMCESTYDCEKSCPNQCCQACTKDGYKFCHCDGGCGQKGCSCLTWEHKKPQHRVETLKAFDAYDGNKPLDLMVRAREFYGALAMWDHSNPKHREIVEEIAARQAKEFLAAIVVACAGEFRSVTGSDVGGNWLTRRQSEGKLTAAVRAKNELDYHLKGSFYIMTRPRGMGVYARRIMAGADADYAGSVRTRSAMVFKKYVIDKYGIEVGLRHHVNFWRMQGGGGVGGVKWERCAWVALQYVQGRLSPIEFVDSAFNLQHNNAILFTKSHALEYRHQQFLNKRQNCDPEWLIARAPTELRKKMGYGDWKVETTEKKEAHTKPVVAVGKKTAVDEEGTLIVDDGEVVTTTHKEFAIA